MDKIRLVIIIGLCVLIGGCWIVYFRGVEKQRLEYESYLQSAEENMSRNLFQKAMEDYEKALKMKEDQDIRKDWLKAAENASQDNAITHKAYADALSKYCSIYPSETEYWEKLVALLVADKSYGDARKYYERAVKEGVTSEKLEDYSDEIYYSFSNSRRGFTNVIYSTRGIYTVYGNEKWGIWGADGEPIYDCEYSYIGPAGRDALYFINTEEDSRIYDGKSVVQSVIKPQEDVTKAIGDGIVPICNKQKWKFYDISQGKYILSEYDDVSVFANGKAVVKKNDKWNIVDKNGDKVGDASFDDVVLLENGEFIYDGIMIAKTAKGYGIYDANGAEKTEFKAEQMDFYLGEWLAFKDKNGKWGFVDVNGEVQIKPEYEEAKSFSTGLAAVKKDGKWGFINPKNKMVIDNIYLNALYFSNKGICFVGETSGSYYMLKLRFIKK
ncbi:MAG: WG repeat-containing protein [Lachnospiraceae bacterium]|nr:WG repeat-containing protein [Lachnospiraceae bacterium]